MNLHPMFFLPDVQTSSYRSDKNLLKRVEGKYAAWFAGFWNFLLAGWFAVCRKMGASR